MSVALKAWFKQSIGQKGYHAFSPLTTSKCRGAMQGKVKGLALKERTVKLPREYMDPNQSVNSGSFFLTIFPDDFHIFAGIFPSMLQYPPETNIAPGNQWLEDEIPFGMAHVQGRTLGFREGRRYKKMLFLSKLGHL